MRVSYILLSVGLQLFSVLSMDTPSVGDQLMQGLIARYNRHILRLDGVVVEETNNVTTVTNVNNSSSVGANSADNGPANPPSSPQVLEPLSPYVHDLIFLHDVTLTCKGRHNEDARQAFSGFVQALFPEFITDMINLFDPATGLFRDMLFRDREEVFAAICKVIFLLPNPVDWTKIDKALHDKAITMFEFMAAHHRFESVDQYKRFFMKTNITFGVYPKLNVHFSAFDGIKALISIYEAGRFPMRAAPNIVDLMLVSLDTNEELFACIQALCNVALGKLFLPDELKAGPFNLENIGMLAYYGYDIDGITNQDIVLMEFILSNPHDFDQTLFQNVLDENRTRRFLPKFILKQLLKGRHTVGDAARVFRFLIRDGYSHADLARDMDMVAKQIIARRQ